ncbi:MAG: hypothetical protein O2960_15175 [Verrucomicrobia bacterium]|nr:hypothetical protein [Verrucomicrobiota bacterium]
MSQDAAYLRLVETIVGARAVPTRSTQKILIALEINGYINLIGIAAAWDKLQSCDFTMQLGAARHKTGY